MLIRLFGKNFRSLREPFELSLVAADLKRDADSSRGVIEAPITGLDEPLRLLRVAAIYGPNASGKSTVLLAAGALNWLVTASSPQSKPDAPIAPYEPFALDLGTREAPIELGCEVVCGKAIIRYEIAYTRNSIIRETLSKLTGNKETSLLDRSASGKITGSLIKESEANRLYVEGMQPNVSVLSKLAQHGPQKGRGSVQTYYRAINAATSRVDYSLATEKLSVGPSTERFAADETYRRWIMDHLIRPSDTGIRNASARLEPLDVTFVLRRRDEVEHEIPMPDRMIDVRFEHEGIAAQELRFEDESAGTKKLFYLSGEWWRLAHSSTSLFADELSASLHPRLLDRLIRAINEPTEDDARSQLIFATHDTGLLEGVDGQPPALRRDQVYFTNKDAGGACEIYGLAEFKEDARPVHNLRKRYLSGLYGALPAVESLSL